MLLDLLYCSLEGKTNFPHCRYTLLYFYFFCKQSEALAPDQKRKVRVLKRRVLYKPQKQLLYPHVLTDHHLVSQFIGVYFIFTTRIVFPNVHVYHSLNTVRTHKH